MRAEKKTSIRAGGIVAIAVAGALITSVSAAQSSQREATRVAGASPPVPTVAITVPWQGDPGLEHQTYSGATLVLQGIARVAPGCTLTSAEWDPGDGTGYQPVPCGDPRVLELAHVYTAPDHVPFTATLRVADDCGTVSTDVFRVRVVPKNLHAEA